MFDRNDPPGLGAHLAREDRWSVCYDAAGEEVNLSPEFFNKKYGTEISDKDWKIMVEELVLREDALDGLAIERAEHLFDGGNGAGEDDWREDR